MALHRMAACAASAMMAVTACAPGGPLRKADQTTLTSATNEKCQVQYAPVDESIYKLATDFTKTNDERNQFLTDEAKKISVQEPCWYTAHEQHKYYDLFYAEFDDEGNAPDATRGVAYKDSELYLIETSLKTMLDSETGLNLVVFTHGWHGNARADNGYSLEFKGLLMDISKREEILAHSRTATPTAASAANPQKPFRTVGIEVAWRGDSFDTYVNVWDRKKTADTISKGAVHELFAFLNQFYQDHSCHGAAHNRAPEPAGCASVHMLSIGHSFGALIDFQAFVGRLESGLNVDPCDRAYGFGDMTILLNPAFEGIRYRALFNDGLSRPAIWGNYYGDDDGNSKCDSRVTHADGEPQVPTVVTFQSGGDWATGTTFPIFRWLSTRFTQALSSQESYETVHAVGWIPQFRTHGLACAAVDQKRKACTTAPTGPTVDTCAAAMQFSGAGAPKSFCPFADANVDTDAVDAAKNPPLVLTFSPAAIQGPIPNYLPLWSVFVDKTIMYDHDDFWNPQIVRMISLLYEDAYEQTERLHGQRSRAGTRRNESN